MIRLWMIERDGARRFDLGTFKEATAESALPKARARHPWLAKMETGKFDFKAEQEFERKRK